MRKLMRETEKLLVRAKTVSQVRLFVFIKLTLNDK